MNCHRFVTVWVMGGCGEGRGGTDPPGHLQRVDPVCRGHVGITRVIVPLSDYLLITTVLKASQEPQYTRGFT